MIEGNKGVCPICNGLDPELRVGLDVLFEKSKRNIYDYLHQKYSQQCGSTMLRIIIFRVECDSDESLKIILRARCDKCKAVWDEEILVKPQKKTKEGCD
jgi:hypothetical protein